jgi:predicted AlkP superfamily pyrophosphatase or phosphodiesterase
MKRKLLTLLVILLASKGFTQQPRLVVGIVVDQMRYEYLFRYAAKYGNGGFKRLMSGGFECRNAQYNYVPTYTGPGHASIYTGTTPAIHGIAANDWFDKKSRKPVYCTADKTVKPVGTTNESGMMSPVNLESTTMGDELEMATNRKARVIAVSLKDRSSILPAGHAADAAYWFDLASGNFVTSSFYRNDLPSWLVDFNAKKLAAHYLKFGWSPVLPLEKYTESIADENPFEKAPNNKAKPTFPYDYKEELAKGTFEIMKYTPYGNDITKDLAIAAIEGEGLGLDSVCDLLCVSFSSTDYIGHAYGPRAIEVEDAYIRLDKNLEDLFNHLDNKVGKGNYTLFLTADHGAAENPSFLQSMKIPAGYVDHHLVKRKLKEACFREYKDSLVLEYANQQVYLNDTAILKKSLDKIYVEKFCARLLMAMPEVSDVLLGEQLAQVSQNDLLFRGMVQRGYYPRRSGDICVAYKPGYMEHEKTGTTHGSGFSYDTRVPLLLYGRGISAGSTLRTVYVTDIASTFCQLLNIPYPNGNIGSPIFEAIK